MQYAEADVPTPLPDDVMNSGGSSHKLKLPHETARIPTEPAHAWSSLESEY